MKSSSCRAKEPEHNIENAFASRVHTASERPSATLRRGQVRKCRGRLSEQSCGSLGSGVLRRCRKLPKQMDCQLTSKRRLKTPRDPVHPALRSREVCTHPVRHMLQAIDMRSMCQRHLTRQTIAHTPKRMDATVDVRIVRMPRVPLNSAKWSVIPAAATSTTRASISLIPGRFFAAFSDAGSSHQST